LIENLRKMPFRQSRLLAIEEAGFFYDVFRGAKLVPIIAFMALRCANLAPEVG
jgi:hypothetical protein